MGFQIGLLSSRVQTGPSRTWGRELSQHGRDRLILGDVRKHEEILNKNLLTIQHGIFVISESFHIGIVAAIIRYFGVVHGGLKLIPEPGIKKRQRRSPRDQSVPDPTCDFLRSTSGDRVGFQEQKRCQKYNGLRSFLSSIGASCKSLLLFPSLLSIPHLYRRRRRSPPSTQHGAAVIGAGEGCSSHLPGQGIQHRPSSGRRHTTPPSHKQMTDPPSRLVA